MTADLRTDATNIFLSGVDAVRAAPLVEQIVQIDDDRLAIGDHRWSRTGFDRLIVVGAGKAGAAMTLGLVAAVRNWLPVSGWVNVPADTIPSKASMGPHGPAIEGVTIHPARPAGRNEPTVEGIAGTKQIIQMVATAGPRDLCIMLLSGGGSALLPAPIAGITLEEKLTVIRFLSGAGADIAQLNTVRKHLSEVKGGGLLRKCRAGELITLVLSDVLGDPLDLIASGPTVADTSNASDALAVLTEFDPHRQLPSSIYDCLDRQAAVKPTNGEHPADDSEFSHTTTIVIGNNALAVDEAGSCAERLGYNHVMQSARQCEGLAEDLGRHLAELTIDMLEADPSDHRTDCLISGGEPTVKLAPVETRGRGGRNQQLVLAAYRLLITRQLSDEQWKRLCILSGGTDGEDGPTDAAGAILDAEVHRTATRLQLDPQSFLDRNDAYSFFQQTGGLLITGPTGTNVCDLRVAVVAGDASGPPKLRH